MVKTHPHISSPTSADLVRVAGERPFVNVYVALHELVMATLPDIVNSVDEVDAAVGYGAHQYGYNGWGTLLKGAELDDPAGLFTGSATMRHVKLATLDELARARDGIAGLLLAASRANA
jgi:hypothetical protein